MCRFLPAPSARRATWRGSSSSARSARFLSTPSARRATAVIAARRPPSNDFYPRPPRGGRLDRAQCPRLRSYFYPRPPRGGRPPSARPSAVMERISIHALREEGDRALPDDLRRGKGFLSTPSARRATGYPVDDLEAYGISIHALREEGDDFDAFATLSTAYFYPRPPRGGRPLT